MTLRAVPTIGFAAALAATMVALVMSLGPSPKAAPTKSTPAGPITTAEAMTAAAAATWQLGQASSTLTVMKVASCAAPSGPKHEMSCAYTVTSSGQTGCARLSFDRHSKLLKARQVDPKECS